MDTVTLACAFAKPVNTPDPNVILSGAPCSALTTVAAMPTPTDTASATKAGLGSVVKNLIAQMPVMDEELALQTECVSVMLGMLVWVVRLSFVQMTVLEEEHVLMASASVPRVSKELTVLHVNAPTIAANTDAASMVPAAVSLASEAWTVAPTTAPMLAHTTASANKVCADATLATLAMTAPSAFAPTIARTTEFAKTSLATATLDTLDLIVAC